MKEQKEKGWLMRIFGQGKESPGDMEIADDLEVRSSGQADDAPEELICRNCAGSMEVIDATIKREREAEKEKADKRLTSPIKRANGNG